MVRSGVLFDFDGTLADTRMAILGAMRLAYEDLALGPIDEAGVVGAVGLSLSAVVRAGGADVPPEVVDTVVARYRYHFPGASAGSTHLFSGVREALYALQDAGVVMGIATSKGRAGLMPLLDSLEIQGFFSAVVCDDDVVNKKPHRDMVDLLVEALDLDRRTSWVVGDAVFDMQMAKAAGLLACGVGWGNQTLEQLKAAGANRLVTTASELALLVSAGDH